ncbi:hypothetical protein ACTFIW_003859 [Dictyostelium discoideum]
MVNMRLNIFTNSRISILIKIGLGLDRLNSAKDFYTRASKISQSEQTCSTYALNYLHIPKTALFTVNNTAILAERREMLALLGGQIQDLSVVRHLSTYLRASKGRSKPHSGDSVFIQNEDNPLDVKEINIIVLSTLSSSGIDISKFKFRSTRSAMASLLLSNNVPFHVVKKMGRWKSNDAVDTFYDKRIIGEKSGGFLNTIVQIS